MMNTGITRTEFQKLLNTQTAQNGSKLFTLDDQGKIVKNDKLTALFQNDKNGDRLEEAFKNLQNYAGALDVAGNAPNIGYKNSVGDNKFGISGFDRLAKLTGGNAILGDADLTVFYQQVAPSPVLNSIRTPESTTAGSAIPGAAADVKVKKASPSGNAIEGSNQKLVIDNTVGDRLITTLVNGPNGVQNLIRKAAGVTGKEVAGSFNTVTFQGGIKNNNFIGVEGLNNLVVIKDFERRDQLTLRGAGWELTSNSPNGKSSIYKNDLTGSEVRVFRTTPLK